MLPSHLENFTDFLAVIMILICLKKRILLLFIPYVNCFSTALWDYFPSYLSPGLTQDPSLPCNLPYKHGRCNFMIGLNFLKFALPPNKRPPSLPQAMCFLQLHFADTSAHINEQIRIKTNFIKQVISFL